MKRVYQVTYRSVIVFDEDDVAIDLRTPEIYEVIAGAAFFANQVGEYKLRELTWDDPTSGEQRERQFIEPICFEHEDDMEVVLLHRRMVSE